MIITGKQFAEKLFSKYDDTDEIKRMKDSDILDAKQKTVPIGSSIRKTLLKSGIGAGIGTASGAIIGGLIGKKQGKGFDWNSIKKGALTGVTIGTASGALKAIGDNAKEEDDVNFYNRRLRQAKRQAKRREKKDWEDQTKRREGYSY